MGLASNGFDILELSLILVVFLSVPMIRKDYIFMHRLADHNEDYAPFQIDWVGVQAKQLQREGSVCGFPEPPGDWRNPLLGL